MRNCSGSTHVKVRPKELADSPCRLAQVHVLKVQSVGRQPGGPLALAERRLYHVAAAWPTAAARRPAPLHPGGSFGRNDRQQPHERFFYAQRGLVLRQAVQPDVCIGIRTSATNEAWARTVVSFFSQRSSGSGSCLLFSVNVCSVNFLKRTPRT